MLYDGLMSLYLEYYLSRKETFSLLKTGKIVIKQKVCFCEKIFGNYISI